MANGMPELTKSITVTSKKAMVDARASKDIVAQLIKETILVEGVDFGKIPGTDKSTLLKPGAERLCKAFHLAPRFETVTAIERWDGDNPLFFYRVRTTLIHIETGLEIATGVGSCNSWETKYRWRWVIESDVPPHLDKSKLTKKAGTLTEPVFAINKAETTGKYGKPAEYWQQFKDAIASETARKTTKEMGGKKYDAWEIGGTLYRVPNDQVFDLVNTVDKMAQKRSLISAVLIGTNASEFFAQGAEFIEGFGVDYDEDIIDAEFTEITPSGSSTPPTTTTPPSPAPEPPASSKIVTLPPPPPAPESGEEPTISGEKAKEALNQSSTPSRLGIATWATEDSLKEMFSFIRDKMNMHDVSDNELAKSVGLEVYAADAWNRAYYERKLAVVAIRDAINQQLSATPPAAPKAWTADEKQIFINWVENNFGKTIADVETELTITTDIYTVYKSPFDAMTAITALAEERQWQIITTTAYYNGQYIDFETVIGRIRVYGRSTDFQKTVGSGYYAANNIGAWKADAKQPLAVAPLALWWDARSSDKGNYKLSDKGKQTPVTPVPDVVVETPVDESMSEADLADAPF